MPTVGAALQTMPIPIGSSGSRATCGASHRGASNSSNLDFGAYLLAASPPVNFAFSYAVGRQSNGDGDCNGNQRKLVGGCWDVSNVFDLNGSGKAWSAGVDDIDWVAQKREASPSQRLRKNGYAASVVVSEVKKLNNIRSCLRIPALADDKPGRTISSPQLSFSADRMSRVKKVSFADDIGRKLYKIRLFEESPDTPFIVDPAVLQRHTLGTSSSCPDIALRLSGVASPESAKSPSTSSNKRASPVLLPNFPMPAASYAAFRKKVDDEFVSLESIHQVESTGSLCGTIKVKEGSFEKTVFVRYTLNHWQTSLDAFATYVAPKDPPGGRLPPFATFSFRIDLPSATNSCYVRNVQFAVCYRTADKEYWDNNGGSNYELNSPDWSDSGCSQESREKQDGRSVFHAKDSEGWASYASWTEVDSSVPYW